ncbi:PREDICTED: glutaredoxin-1 [Nanorana parkeri]|uniref:glutaredoxin-1 n=1 Tax=Nanorana parkeri TaxID=125878 RepID=UPI000853FEC9|nr:PREDICTED: glutaredoxin-1 [Nanorana parkeri]
MAQSFVDAKLRAGKVTVFEKESCPFCVRAKTIIHKYKFKKDRLEIINIANMENVSSIQDYLCQLSGERTVPRIFIEKECIGGCSDLVPLDSSGELEKRLIGIGALEQ